MKLRYIILITALCCVSSNYFWQIAQEEPRWAVAAERSWFQVTALLIFWQQAVLCKKHFGEIH